MFWRRKQPKYGYQPVGDMVFVKSLPQLEVDFRDDPDGQGHTWSKLSLDAQVRTFGDYFAHAQQVAGWSGEDLKAGFKLARRIIARVDREPTKEAIPSLLFGQRFATGIAKIAFSRARERRESHYHQVGPNPYDHLEPWELSSDRIFAHLRLAGMNPVLVRTVSTPDEVERCAPLATVTEEFARAGHGDFAGALRDGRVTVLPPEAYVLLDHLRAAAEPEHPYERRFFCQPTAVFVRRESERHLRPVAIRCHRDFAAITPNMGQIWERAKLYVQVADSLCQTFVSHLPHTHFLMEPVILATRNELGFDHVGAEHPVRRLLEPHLEGTMAVNRVAKETLLDGSSSFLEFVGCDVASTAVLVSAAWRQRATTFETTFEANRVADVDPGLVYPYRDDFAKLAPLLAGWVESYLGFHYPSDEDVVTDQRVQAWSDALRDPTRGRLVGIPPIHDRSTLRQVLTTIVQLATLQHASFHFPQTDLGRLGYLSPFYAADVPPGQCVEQEGSLRRLDSLPDLHAAAWQSFVLGQSDLRWGTLRDMPRRFNRAPRERQRVQQLWADLQEIEAEIVLRNAGLVDAGLTPYRYLQPSMVPCSINT